jgi:hypothetical protein
VVVDDVVVVVVGIVVVVVEVGGLAEQILFSRQMPPILPQQ